MNDKSRDGRLTYWVSSLPACGLVRGVSVGVCAGFLLTPVCERGKMKLLSRSAMIKVASEQL